MPLLRRGLPGNGGVKAEGVAFPKRRRQVSALNRRCADRGPIPPLERGAGGVGVGVLGLIDGFAEEGAFCCSADAQLSEITQHPRQAPSTIP